MLKSQSAVLKESLIASQMMMNSLNQNTKIGQLIVDLSKVQMNKNYQVDAEEGLKKICLKAHHQCKGLQVG